MAKVKPLVMAFILLIYICTFFQSTPYVKADGENWLSGFIYRKSHVVENATGAGANYQINFTVWYGSGSDSGNHVYLNSHSQTDFDDVRFTDNDGDTLLDYWRESYNVSSNATFWVEVADSLESNDVTIYVYYGNATCATTSNIFNTFPFADDFNDNSYTSGLNWTTESGAPVEAGGTLTVEGDKLRSTNTVIVGHKLRTNATFGSLVDNGQIGANDIGAATERIYFWGRTGNNNITHTRDAGLSEDKAQAYDTNFHVYEYHWEVTDQVVTFFIDRALIQTHSTRVPDDAMIIRLNSATGNPVMVFDWIVIAKYVSPEPVHAAWGVEAYAAFYVTFYHTTGGIVRVDNVTTANATETGFPQGSLVEFEIVAIVEGNLTYGFDNFTRGATYNYSNPYNESFTITANTTIWTYFVELEEGGTLPSQLFTGVMILAASVGFILFLVWDKRKK